MRDRPLPPESGWAMRGAIIAGGKGKAQDKIEALKAAGITVSPTLAELGKTVLGVMEGA